MNNSNNFQFKKIVEIKCEKFSITPNIELFDDGSINCLKLHISDTLADMTFSNFSNMLSFLDGMEWAIKLKL
jgi:hypothetical protein